MSTSISSGNVYQILTRYHNGGSVSAGEPGLRFLSLVNDVNADAEKWIFYATGEPGAFRIESFRRRSHFAVENPPMGYIFQDDTQDEPTTWYLRQADYIESSLDQNYNYHICSTLDCSIYWVPTRFNVEPPGEEDNTITLRQRPLAGNGFELWRIRPVLGIDVAPTSSFSEEEEEEISSSSVTSSASFTTVSAPATTSVEHRPPQSSATGDHGQQSNTLKKCAPCGSTECSFTPSGEPQKATYSVLIGQPVYNCDNGSAETTTAKFGGTYQLQNSWSVEVSVTAGFGFMGPSISSTVTGTTGGTKVVIQTQEIEVGIRPGQIGALVANISYITQPGQVNVDDR
ncbi:hypothetical protein BKA70DRAFT_1439516 [Coprinopsis sp. MPI-PUGE-AT-0042]|nr:hypothetical protein BKA70DRAFT_1439516 [Coprinopsis sp. MPI-PUGE-AT-0042]